MPDGTKVVVTETGFDRIPPERRGEAFDMNEKGWETQVTLLEKYIAAGASA